MHSTTEAIAKPTPDTMTRTSRRSSAGPYLSPAASFNLLASITLAFLAGSSAPTPLYRSEERRVGKEC